MDIVQVQINTLYFCFLCFSSVPNLENKIFAPYVNKITTSSENMQKLCVQSGFSICCRYGLDLQPVHRFTLPRQPGTHKIVDAILSYPRPVRFCFKYFFRNDKELIITPCFSCSVVPCVNMFMTKKSYFFPHCIYFLC